MDASISGDLKMPRKINVIAHLKTAIRDGRLTGNALVRAVKIVLAAERIADSAKGSSRVARANPGTEAAYKYYKDYGGRKSRAEWIKSALTSEEFKALLKSPLWTKPGESSDSTKQTKTWKRNVISDLKKAIKNGKITGSTLVRAVKIVQAAEGVADGAKGSGRVAPTNKEVEATYKAYKSRGGRKNRAEWIKSGSEGESLAPVGSTLTSEQFLASLKTQARVDPCRN
ncbi:MAG: hypothetical protein WBD87_14060 [Candidatus Acidiferrales bacterium]